MASRKETQKQLQIFKILIVGGGVGVMTKTLNAIRYLLLEFVYELLHN